MKEFVGLTARTYNYLKDIDNKGAKPKRIIKCAIKREQELEHYKKCLEAARNENKIRKIDR